MKEEALDRIKRLLQLLEPTDYRIPFELFTTPICKGASVFGTECGKCEKCVYVRRNPPPHRPTAEELAEELKDAESDLKSLLDAYEAMREENGKLLAFAVREVRGCDLSSHFDEMERITGQRYRGTKQTLGGHDE